MTPLPPTLPAPPTALTNLVQRTDAQGVAAVGARPQQGAMAVTAATATGETARDDGTDASADRVEPPPDPPPVKGLGVPPLNLTRVGDGDDIPKPPDPEAMRGDALSDRLAALKPPETPTVDRLA